MTSNQTINGVPRELLERIMHGCMFSLSRQQHEELRALLDASAHPCPVQLDGCDGSCSPAVQPQGEPVVFVDASELRNLKVSGFESFSALLYRGQASMLCPQRVALYAKQPAPVAVVMPERREPKHYWPRFGKLTAIARVAAEEWNACLDEVTRLNTRD